MRNLILSALLFLFSALLLIFYDNAREEKSKPKDQKAVSVNSLKPSPNPQNHLATATR